MNYNTLPFSVGDTVNVHRKDENDNFNHDFTGTIIKITPEYVEVKDQEDDVFCVDFDQISFNTDDVMHDN